MHEHKHIFQVTIFHPTFFGYSPVYLAGCLSGASEIAPTLNAEFIYFNTMNLDPFYIDLGKEKKEKNPKPT